tara:strand:- start:803 stop:2746 length:1944 start_codon:yes stop_codon:yes gene_type:complete
LPNELKNEKSPYLKQHENNPVDWLPWKKNTLDKAKKERKPIFLSVGYASCHWCHVMAHESFENNDTAKIMNEKFINIKVDREERPDLDSIFQKSLGVLTGAQGGWPLSMFLDENAVPFTGGTYFPPKEMHGRPSFTQVLENVSKVYSENREKIIAQVSQLQMVFKEFNRKNAVLNQNLEPYAEKIIQYFDEINGGFKGAPKFPQFYVFDTIFYFYKKNNDKKFLTPVEKLLNNISSKGIYDQLEGGIARYTVDEKWIVPHFEKMLYDNILYVNLLNQFLQKENSDYLKNKLIQTIKFINSEFVSENTLLGSAYDADSEGIEGKYYIWKYDEIKSQLKNKFEIFNKKYLISKEGNFEGSNILIENTDNKFTDEEVEKLKEAESLLLIERKKRIKPFFDNKVQTDLNCFWLYSNLYSSLILDDQELYKKTIDSIDHINDKLKKNIFHCYNKKNEEIDVFLEDYVYYSLLLITMYEINNDKASLDKCEKKMEECWQLFFNKENNLLQKNILKSNDLFVQPIDIGDSNVPNGNSIYLLICSKLKNITNNKLWNEKLDILSKSFHSYINYNFSQMFSYLKILDICAENITVTLHGKINEKIKNEILKKFMGNVSIIYKESNDEFFIVICKNQTCSKKLKDLNEVDDYIKNNL